MTNARPVPTLDALIAAFGLHPREVQCFDPAHPYVDAQRPLLVLASEVAAARAVVSDRYPPGHVVRVLRHTPRTGTPFAIDERTVEYTVVAGPSPGAVPGDIVAWLVPPLAPEDDRRGLLGLRAVMERLAGPNGCPWDREQTPESLRQYVLEEAYEVVDAIDRGEAQRVPEELGDLLMQVFLHAALAQEQGAYRLEDVLASITGKMVRRHPHVFAGETVESREQLLGRWDAIKAQERAAAGDEATTSPFDAVPLALPALRRAQSLLGRAERIVPATEGSRVAVPDALAAAEAHPSPVTFGDLLWSVATWACALDIDAEDALREASLRFVARLASGDRPV